MASRILTDCPTCDGSSSGGFYGLTVAETDGNPTFRGIVKINFNSGDFYLDQNAPNTDEVIVNLRSGSSSGSSSAGEANTASNLGGGAGVFAQKVGVDLQFKSLTAGSGITLTPSSTEILITATGSGGGFYGIIFKDGDTTLRDDEIRFNHNDFYLTQEDGKPVLNLITPATPAVDTSLFALRSEIGPAFYGVIFRDGDTTLRDDTIRFNSNEFYLTEEGGKPQLNLVQQPIDTSNFALRSEIGPAFYGILVKESEAGGYKKRNDVIVFDSNDFYLTSSGEQKTLISFKGIDTSSFALRSEIGPGFYGVIFRDGDTTLRDDTLRFNPSDFYLTEEGGKPQLNLVTPAQAIDTSVFALKSEASPGFYGVIFRDGRHTLRDDTLRFNPSEFYLTEEGGKPQLNLISPATVIDTSVFALRSEIGPGFYGLTAAQTDGLPSYSGINTLKFLAADFYLTQNSPNTDQAIVNLRHRLTKINDSGGTVNVQAKVVPEPDATHDLGGRANRFANVHAQKLVVRQSAGARNVDNYSGGSIIGYSSAAAGGNAGLINTTKNGLALGAAYAFASGGLARIRAEGGFAIGYAGSYTSDSYIRSQTVGATALGFVRSSSTGAARLRAYQNGAFAQGSASAINNAASTIYAIAPGAFAQGVSNALFAGLPTSIVASANGAFAQGHALGGNIQAYATGSSASGYAFGANIATNSTAKGSQAMGYANGANVSTGSGAKGALAIGYASTGLPIAANATNAFQFGPGTNATALSLQVGSKIQLLGTPGRVAAVTGRFSDIVEADAFYLNKGGETANAASNLGTGAGIFAQKVDDVLQFKSLTASSNIALTSSATEIQISAIGGFYGITVAESDGRPSYSTINTLKFFAPDFYIEQNATNTDEVVVNLRERLRFINESGGTINLGANVVPEGDGTRSVGSDTLRFSDLFVQRVIARTSSAGQAAGPGASSGGSIFGHVQPLAGSTAQITTGSVTNKGSIAGGYARTTVAGRTAAVKSTGNGSFASGMALNGSTYAYTSYIEASGSGSLAFGYANTTGGVALINATNKGCFALGYVNNITGTTANTIRATAPGAMAGGYIAGTGTSLINASGAGSFAWGRVSNQTCSASGISSVQFGPGTNSTNNSLQVSSSIRLIGGTGEINWTGPLNHDGTTVGFFAKTPVTQRADCFYLKVNYTATTDAVLEDVTGTPSQTIINANFAELAAKVNRIRDALRALGLMAGG